MVIDPSNVISLSDSVNHLVRIGFKNLNWDINYEGNWTAESLSKLKIELNKLTLNYLKDLKNNNIYIISNFYCFFENSSKLSLFLMPDGNFYFNEVFYILENNMDIFSLRNVNDLINTYFEIIAAKKENGEEKLENCFKFNTVREFYYKELNKIFKIFKKSNIFKKIYQK
jgi:hypothetical protein